MFQCIIQQKTGWMKGSPEMKDVFPDIRCQLGEQLRCLDSRMDSQVALVAELQDYFRRRAEVELDYSKGLDKLAKGLLLRHREQKQRREQWPLFSSFSCWQQLICHTKGLSRDHAALADIFSVHLVGKMSDIMDDVQRIYRKCREVGYDGHEELLRVLHELHTTSKTWLSYQAEARHADTKLKLAEAQRTKLDNVIPVEKRERSKKYKLMEKEVQKRKNKCNDARVKALKAHNEYVLCLEAANTTVHKYFVDDLSDLIDCMDLGFHHSISSAMMSHVEAEQGRHRSVQTNLDQIVQTVNSLDSRLDKQRFLESNHSAFMMPKKFELQCQRSQQEQENDMELQKGLQHELEARLGQLQNRITTLRTESEEVWKTMETAEHTLLDMLTAKSFELNDYFSESSISLDISKAADTSSLRLSKAPIAPDSSSLKLKADRHETEEFYLGKFQEYILCTNRIARLHSKHDYIRKNMLVGVSDSKHDNESTNGLPLSPAHSNRPPRRKRIGRLQMLGQPKLFGGSLEEYLESTNQEIPLIMKSCIRVINLYGLHHQGIFRVSGSQVEINNFRESFERGEDPLADVTDASDINSVAGVLKLYLRELREPLLPTIYFEHLMELAQLDSKIDFVEGMQEVLQGLPRSVVIVMRYLFAFLNHLSEFSDENMMDPYNLAICFGPTLVPVPDDKDQVQYQNLVNDLIKNMILLCDELFPADGGPCYEKFISREPDEGDVGDSPSEHVHDDMDSEVYPSEDESEPLEATVQFDFRARSQREVSLEKGQQVMLFNQVSNDWWRGSVAGHEGLIPDKYIMLKIKDEDREKSETTTVKLVDESVPEVAPDGAPSENVILSCEEEESESPRVAPPSPTASALEIALTSSEVDSDSLSLSSESSSDSFKQSRELWRSRVEATESAAATTDPSQQQRQKDTPDLVMDLPLNSSANSPSPSAEECSSPQHYGPDSPDMTAAERFAKQNQCTLKKKTSSTSSAVDAQTQTLQPQKPPIKAKPQVLKKPSVVPPPATSNPENDASQTKQ